MKTLNHLRYMSFESNWTFGLVYDLSQNILHGDKMLTHLTERNGKYVIRQRQGLAGPFQ